MKSKLICVFMAIAIAPVGLMGQKVGINTATPAENVHITQPVGTTLTDNESVVLIEYTGTNQNDVIGLTVKSRPTDWYGIGGQFEGGFTGAVGQVINGVGNNSYRGLLGRAFGPGSGSFIGVGGEAAGLGTNYGIYASAFGGTANYAGYFESGNVYINQQVGIGKLSPEYALDILKPQAVVRLNSSNTANGSVIELRNETEASTYLGAINISGPGQNAFGQIGYLSNHNLTFRVNNAERMRINNLGYVGVGHNSPVHPFHVNQPPGTVLAAGLPVMHVEYTGTNMADAIGIRGRCKPQDFYGVGGEFEGGFIGIRGKVTGAGGTGHSYYGVVGEATGSGASTTNFAVYGSAQGPGGAKNWAGYFIGWVFASSRMGIGREPATNALEVEGNASKSSSGDWIANSDARLKKNIQSLKSREMLDKLLSLRGITYEWNDDKTGSKRPEGIHYGFTAQNIQEVFPSLVEEDALGYLQTAYGTYDAMMVEALRALHEENISLRDQITELRRMVEAILYGATTEK